MTMHINNVVNECHNNAVNHGFWANTDYILSKIALIHSELSELAECFRKNPTQKSDHVPEITCVEEELADAVIRIFDLAGYLRVDMEKSISMKMEYNKNRPHMHNKKA